MQIETKPYCQKYKIINLFCVNGALVSLLINFIYFFLNYNFYKSSYEITRCIARKLLKFLAFPVCLSLCFYN